MNRGATKSVSAIVLAAGSSLRMAPAHKLLQPFGTRSVLAATLACVAASRAREIVLVVGHRCEDIARAADGGERVRVVQAADHASGMAASLAAGLAAVHGDGMLVVLGDMPLVRTATIDRLIAAFEAADGTPVIAPVRDGRRGNPVLWHRSHRNALMGLSGDAGARGILERHPDLRLVETDDPGVLIDVDTESSLAHARGLLEP